MAYFVPMGGGFLPHPHKDRVLFGKKIADLLARYPLDDLLSEIAHQQPGWDIYRTTHHNEPPDPLDVRNVKPRTRPNGPSLVHKAVP